MFCKTTPTVLLLTAALLSALASTENIATAEDNFDGAVWSFQMKNKKDRSKVLVGGFRVSDHVLYQKENRSDPKYSKKVGVNKPNGDKTKFEVSDFRVFTKRDKKEIVLEGTGRVSKIKFGEWNGLFTDGKGNNWGIKLSRIKE